MPAVSALSHMKAFLPATLFLLFTSLSVGWLQFRPIQGSDPTIIVFPTSMGRTQMVDLVQRAGGTNLTDAGLPYSIMAQSTDPDFYHNLRKAGALVLLDGTARGACFQTGD